MTMKAMGCVAVGAVAFASVGDVVEIGNSHGTLKVDTFGARAVSYVPADGSEVLASLSDGTGGMPLCWPWFANEGPSADCRRHGVARYSRFGVAAKSGGELSLRLVSDAETRRHFPHDFELTVTFRLGEELTILVEGRNTGTDAFPVTEMIHPYFRVGSAADCVVRGVDGFRYQDNRHPELGDQRVWKGDYPIEDGSRVFEFNYRGVHRWLLEDPVLGRTLRFTGEGDLKTVVWNPGPATLQAANVTSHLKPGEWKTFVCVENGTTYRDRAYLLQPGERHVLRRTILVDGHRSMAVSGTFVQRKVLKDVDVTLTSSGEWSFEKDKAFTWRTLRPVQSLFVATPTNYMFSAGGRVTSRSLKMKIEDVAQIFEIKEMKDFVERVETAKENPVFESDGLTIPSSLCVRFRNGDRLEIELKR